MSETWQDTDIPSEAKGKPLKWNKEIVNWDAYDNDDIIAAVNELEQALVNKEIPLADYTELKNRLDSLLVGVNALNKEVQGVNVINPVESIEVNNQPDDYPSLAVKTVLDKIDASVKANKPKLIQGVKDADVKAELALIKQGIAENKETNELILAKLNSGLDTQVTGSNVELEVNAKIDKMEDLLSSQKSIINIMQADKLIFGVYWDKTSSPLLTRIDASAGLEANAGVGGEFVTNDFDRMPIYSEISEVRDEFGNAFIRIPKFYIKKRDGADFKTWQISKTKYPGFYLPELFWDFESHSELDYFDYGKHLASVEGDKMQSKPNAYPTANENIVNMRRFATNNNDVETSVSGYQQLDIHAIDVLQVLFYVEFATLNSQSIMSGFTSGRYTITELTLIEELQTNRVILTSAQADGYRVGQSIGIGTSQGGNQVTDYRMITAIEPAEENSALVFDGEPIDIVVGNFVYNVASKTGFSSQVMASSGSEISNSDGKQPCVYRGIESPWGDIYQFVDGVNFDDHQTWVAKNAKDYASNLFTSPYEMVGYKNHDSNGYFSEMGHDPNNPYAEFPIESSGGSSTYYSDYYYQATGARIALFGGYWTAGSSAGLSLWNLRYSSSSAHLFLGARLLKKAS